LALLSPNVSGSSGAGSRWNKVSFFSVRKSNLILVTVWKSCGFQRFLFKIGKELPTETPKVLQHAGGLSILLLGN
jgi:hypothetical protein